MSFSLAIVGRPNVGKSTLFNRLVGKRLALVDDQPGVTRDLREGEASLGDLRFTVIDTAGLEDATDDSLQGRMRRLTERAVEDKGFGSKSVDIWRVHKFFAHVGDLGPQVTACMHSVTHSKEQMYRAGNAGPPVLEAVCRFQYRL